MSENEEARIASHYNRGYLDGALAMGADKEAEIKDIRQRLVGVLADFGMYICEQHSYEVPVHGKSEREANRVCINSYDRATGSIVECPINMACGASGLLEFCEAICTHIGLDDEGLRSCLGLDYEG